MKLKNFLKYIDFLTNVDIRSEENMSLFKGKCLDIPWIYADCNLYDEDAIYVEIDDKDEKSPILIIYIEEN